jgi:iron(III) transport system ATP-binding protein
MLEVRHLHYSYPRCPVLQDVSFRVRAGELLCLVGASGCGKSTILRLIAGLETIQKGEIYYQDTLLANATLHTPPEQRRIGLVFQHPSLFPHLTVRQNICFGLTHLPKQQQFDISDEMLQLIGMRGKEESYPHQLSGGQHQRVALARTLAPTPVLMLMDEPFANLDHVLRRDIREEVMEMLRVTNIPVIMVTHDPEEALVMADTMVLLDKGGTVHQTGSPDTIHNHPSDLTSARFFGHINVVAGRVEEEQIVSKLGSLPKQEYAPTLANHSDVLVATRPEGIRLAKEGELCVRAVIERVAHTGAGWLVVARLPEGDIIQFHHIYGVRPYKHEVICVTLEPPHLFVFPIMN